MDKYPTEHGNFSPTDMVNPQTGESLLKSLIEKNQTITSLTIENNELNQKLTEKINEIQKLQNDLQNTKHNSTAFAESANKHFSQSASENTTMRDETAEQKAVLRYQLIGITISVLVVVSFIFAMYYFTK
jgi:predicted RNase H-like nuclease (RuvC/YqgF family)